MLTVTGLCGSETFPTKLGRVGGQLEIEGWGTSCDLIMRMSSTSISSVDIQVAF